MDYQSQDNLRPPADGKNLESLKYSEGSLTFAVAATLDEGDGGKLKRFNNLLLETVLNNLKRSKEGDGKWNWEDVGLREAFRNLFLELPRDLRLDGLPRKNVTYGFNLGDF